QAVVDGKRTFCKINMLTLAGKIDCRRNHPVMQGKYHFYQSSDPRRVCKVSHIAFYGTDAAELVGGNRAESQLQPFNLNRIAERSGRAMCFNISQAFRYEPGIGQRHLNGSCLSCGRWGHKAPFSTPVIAETD